MNNQPESSQFSKKLMCSAIAAAIFILVSLPQVYGQTDRLVNTYENGCPTHSGKFLHAAVFFGLVFALMKLGARLKWSGMEEKSDALHAKYAFYATLLFFVLASSDAYYLSGRLWGGLASGSGCPNVTGVVVHGLVFMAVLVLVMYFPKDE